MPNATVRANARTMSKPSQADIDRAMSDPAYALAVQLIEAMEAARAAPGPEGDAHLMRADRLRAALALTPAKNRSGFLAHVAELRLTAHFVAVGVVLSAPELPPALIQRLAALEGLADRIAEGFEAGVV